MRRIRPIMDKEMGRKRLKKGGRMNERLRNRRDQQGKTQQEIADLAKISLKSYQRIEKGVQDPSVSVAILIARSLKSTVEKLFG